MVMMDCDKCGHPYGFGCHCSDKGMSRADIVKRAQKLRAEIAQAFYDAERWNKLHPQEEAINPDPDGELKRLAEGLDAMLAIEGHNGEVRRG